MFRQRKIRTPRLRKQHRRRRLDAFVRLLALIGSIILLLSQLSMISAMRIDRISVSGNETISAHELGLVVQQELSGYYWGLFSRRNALLYPRFTMRDRLFEEFPRIKTLDINTENFEETALTMTERKRHALYCTGEECFSIDDEGYVFAQAPFFSSPTMFVYGTGSVSYIETPIRRSVLGGGQTFTLFEAFRDTVAELLSQQPVRLEVRDGNAYHVTLENGAEIILNPGNIESYEEVLANLEAILTSEEFLTEAGENLSNLDYLDMRYGRKAFFKVGDSE